MLLWHSGYDNYCDQEAAEDEDKANILKLRNQSIVEDAEGGADDGQEDKGHICMPRFDYVVWMVDCIHCHNNIGFNLDNRGKIEDPAEEVERSSKKSQNSSVFGTGCDRRPMVNTTSGRNGGSELCNTGADERIVEDRH